MCLTGIGIAQLPTCHYSIFIAPATVRNSTPYSSICTQLNISLILTAPSPETNISLPAGIYIMKILCAKCNASLRPFT